MLSVLAEQAAAQAQLQWYASRGTATAPALAAGNSSNNASVGT
jgi:hypothetical protein